MSIVEILMAGSASDLKNNIGGKQQPLIMYPHYKKFTDLVTSGATRPYASKGVRRDADIGGRVSADLNINTYDCPV